MAEGVGGSTGTTKSLPHRRRLHEYSSAYASIRSESAEEHHIKITMESVAQRSLLV